VNFLMYEYECEDINFTKFKGDIKCFVNFLFVGCTEVFCQIVKKQ